MTKKNYQFDRHHLFWQRRYWIRGGAKALRDYWYCSVYIPKNTLHVQIHHNIHHIPVPRGYSVRLALEELERLNRYGAISESDSIEKRLSLLIALFDCIEPKTTEALKEQLQIVRTYNDSPS